MSSFRFRVQGVGVRVQVSGFGCRASGFGFREPVFGFRISGGGTVDAAGLESEKAYGLVQDCGNDPSLSESARSKSSWIVLSDILMPRYITFSNQ